MGPFRQLDSRVRGDRLVPRRARRLVGPRGQGPAALLRPCDVPCEGLAQRRAARRAHGRLPPVHIRRHRQARDAANHLVLRVDNRPRIEWPPAAKQIEWVQYGGILQPVRVETKGPISISDLAVRAEPSGDGATVACAVEITAREAARDVSLRLAVAGDRESSVTRNVTFAAGSTTRHQATLRLGRGAAWSPELPALYDLVATLEQGESRIDQITTRFGIRTIGARGRQLLLNGKPLKIQGVNRYDEYGGFGPNPPLKLVEEELRLMKRTGINLIRAHYPQDPELLALCDRIGILFLEELPINWWGVEWFGKEGRGSGRAHPHSRHADARNHDPPGPEPSRASLSGAWPTNRRPTMQSASR